MLILAFLCTEKMPKNDLFFHCRTKSKELLKKKLSNVTPASVSLLDKVEIRYFSFAKGFHKWFSKSNKMCTPMKAFTGIFFDNFSILIGIGIGIGIGIN